jgi:hypothetical protein
MAGWRLPSRSGIVGQSTSGDVDGRNEGRGDGDGGDGESGDDSELDILWLWKHGLFCTTARICEGLTVNDDTVR